MQVLTICLLWLLRLLEDKPFEMKRNTYNVDCETAAIYEYKGLEIGSCPIKMVDNLSSQMDFLLTNPTKIII